MKKFIAGTLFLFMLICLVQAQGIQFSGFVRNSVYAYSAQKTPDSDKTELHTRLYQTLHTDVYFKQLGGWQMHIAGRALTDLAESDLSELKRFKAYRFSISKKNLFHMIDLEIGRQFLHPGLVLGSIDGLNVTLKPLPWFSWQVYGGVESHLLRAAKIYDFEEATVLGTQFKFTNLFNSTASLVYLQKRRQGTTQWQLVGLNFFNHRIDNLLILLQAHYDLVNNRFHRLYLSGRYRLNSKFLINAYVKQQYPQIYNDSYFKIFEVEKYWLSGLNCVYQLTENYALSAMMQGVQLEEGYGNRFIVLLSTKNGNLGVVYELGDLGNQLGALFNYRYQLMRHLLLTLNLDYTRYRFEKQFDYDHQLANAVGLQYQFLKHWNLRLEYQWLQNKDYKSDQRVLNHISFVW